MFFRGRYRHRDPVRALFVPGAPLGYWPVRPGINLWQDTAKTIPAVNVGDPVRVLVPMAGVAAVDATAPSDSARPTIARFGSGRYGLSYDGLNDYMDTGYVWQNKPNTVFGARIIRSGGSGYRAAANMSNNANWAEGFTLYASGANLDYFEFVYAETTSSAGDLSAESVVTGVLSGGTSLVNFRNRLQVGSKTDSPAQAAQSLLIGAGRNASSTPGFNMWNGIIGDIVLLERGQSVIEAMV